MLFQFGNLWTQWKIFSENSQVKADKSYRHIGAVLVTWLFLSACSDNTTHSEVSGKVNVASIASELAEYRTSVSSWSHTVAREEYPYAIYTDSEGLNTHHALITKLANETAQLSYDANKDVNASGMTRDLLGYELKRHIGFMVVMERFPHRFALSSVLLNDVLRFLEANNAKQLPSSTSDMLVRWFTNQSKAIEAGAEQKIRLSKYETDAAIKTLGKIERLLPKANNELAEKVNALAISLEKSKLTARNQLGIWGMPNGKDWYQAQFAFRTQTSQTAEALYNRGMKLQEASSIMSHSKDDITMLLNETISIIAGVESSALNSCMQDNAFTVLTEFDAVCVDTLLKPSNKVSIEAKQLQHLIYGDNVLPIMLVMLQNSKNKVGQLIQAQALQTELALVTTELGIHQFKWSLDFAKQFLQQRSSLSKEQIQAKLYSIITMPGHVSISAARYFELQELVQRFGLDSNFMERNAHFLVRVPASQWARAIEQLQSP